MDFSAKANFAKGPTAAQWTEVVSSRPFIEAVGASMLQMQSNLGMAARVDDAASSHYKMEGARIFLSILMNLTTPPEEIPNRTTNDNLIHG